MAMMPKKMAIAMLPIDVVIVYFILLWVVDDSDFPPNPSNET